MKLNTPKRLVLSKETLRNLGVRTGIKAGATTANCSQQQGGC